MADFYLTQTGDEVQELLNTVDPTAEELASEIRERGSADDNLQEQIDNLSADAYRKPQAGIPAIDMTLGVQESLANANASIAVVGDKSYTPDEFSGLGRVNLERNFQTIEGVEKNILTQDMFYKTADGQRVPNTNTIFVIQYDYDLNGEEITIPEGCILRFEGGSLSNGTLIGQETILVHDRDLEDILTDVTLDGTFIEKAVKNSDAYTFVVDIAKYGITEGQMTKDGEGHYSSEQYTTMYNNMLGFNQAFKDAIDAKVSKVIVPEGIYCFCPCYTTLNCSQILQIYEANDIAFDFSNSTFKLCFDSTQRSQYQTLPATPVFASFASLIAIATSTNVIIENLLAVGDRFERSYADSSEKNQEGTYGITVGIMSDNIEIRNCDLSGFMGDGIGCTGYYQTSLTTGVILNENRVLLDREVGGEQPFTNYGYYYKYNRTTVEKKISNSDEFYTISRLIACSDVYKETFTNVSNRAKELSEKKIYALWHNSGYNHTIDCARFVDVLTYKTSDPAELPSRVFKVEQLSNFQLEEGEEYFRIQCHDEVDTPNPVEGEPLSTTLHTMAIEYATCGRITIRNNYIHDNHRGGISNLEGEVLICDNIFKKIYTDNPPIAVAGNTNYHIDFEDVNASVAVITRNRFISNGPIVGALLFPMSPKRLIFTNNWCSRGIDIGRHYEAIITNNYFGNYISIGEFIRENSNFDKNGGRTLRRNVNIEDNTIGGLTVTGNYHSDISVRHNYIQCEFGNIGIPLSQFKSAVSNLEFSKNIIKLDGAFFGMGIIPLIGKNNSISGTKKPIVFPFLEDTDISNFTFQSFPDGDEYSKTIHYKNKILDVSPSINSIFYNNHEFENFTINAPFGTFIVKKGKSIVFRNCTFNTDIIKPYSNVFGEGTENAVLRFIGCTFNVDSLCIRFSTYKNPNVTIEAVNCKAGIKEDTTPYKAMLTNNAIVPAYNKTLVSQSSGTSDERPEFPPLHYQYFDTTLGKPVYASEIDSETGEVTWVDATGTTV